MLEGISVIIPVYNEIKDNLCRAIYSVFAQSYKGPVEIIVVDDGSNADFNTEFLDHGFLKQPFDKMILKRIRKDKNEGTASAFNVGINNSVMPFISWLSSDDQWHPNKLEIQMRSWKESHWDWCFTGWEEIERRTMGVYAEPYFKNVVGLGSDINKFMKLQYRPDKFMPGFINACTCIWKRSLHDTVGLFDTKLSRVQDIDMWIRFAYAGFKPHLIPLSTMTRQKTNFNQKKLIERNEDIHRIQNKIYKYMMGEWE